MKQGLLLLLLLPALLHAQPLPSIEDKTKNAKANQGFLNFYWDESAGKIYLEISKLDSELLYQTSLPAGLGSNDVGLDRGLIGITAIVKFTRVGTKVLLVQPNYAYRALTNNAAEKQAV